jgi:hypothetical protein
MNIPPFGQGPLGLVVLKKVRACLLKKIPNYPTRIFKFILRETKLRIGVLMELNLHPN